MTIDPKSLFVVVKATEDLDGCDLDELRMLVSHDLYKEIELENAESIKRCLLRRCNIYIVCVKNLNSGETSIVRRRFSDFYRLRQTLLKLVPCKRESYCSWFIKQIPEFTFPRRRLFRSRHACVVSQRVDSLERFVWHVLSCHLVGNFRMYAATAQSVHN
uniref:Uncharacterized protein AlNc14C9G1198 n=1 Tax=Albugo laibachii Nc14 TaxID=890382 RepID=F0W2E7_9STRA|nr:conserved hypothetical protein [Albugo laibachii Nc14]|eukprot:CCA15233.1 conserved hypothetical protein [Albugo laibachii Nc14]